MLLSLKLGFSSGLLGLSLLPFSFGLSLSLDSSGIRSSSSGLCGSLAGGISSSLFSFGICVLLCFKCLILSLSSCVGHLLLHPGSLILDGLDLRLQLLQPLGRLLLSILVLSICFLLSLVSLLLRLLELFRVVVKLRHLHLLLSRLNHSFPGFLLIRTLDIVDLFGNGSNSCTARFTLLLCLIPGFDLLVQSIHGTSNLGRVRDDSSEGLVRWLGGRANLERFLVFGSNLLELGSGPV